MRPRDCHFNFGFADPGVTDPFNLLFPQITRIADTGPLLTDYYSGLEFQSKARSVKMSTPEFYHLSYRTHANKLRAKYLRDHDQVIQVATEKLEYLNSTCPPQKTASLLGFEAFINHKLKHLDQFINHYDARYRKLLMRVYRGTLLLLSAHYLITNHNSLTH